MNGDEKQKEADSREERRARRRERSSQVLQMLKEQQEEQARKAETERQAAAEGREKKPAENVREAEGSPMPSVGTSEHMEQPTEAAIDAGAGKTEEPVMSAGEPSQSLEDDTARTETAEPDMEHMEATPGNTVDKNVKPDDHPADREAEGEEPDKQEIENSPGDKTEAETVLEDPKAPEAAKDADAPEGTDAAAIEQEEVSLAEDAGQDVPAPEEPQQEPSGQTLDGPAKEPSKDVAQQHGQDQPEAGDRDSRQKKRRDGQPFHKEDPPKDKDGRPKGLFARIRGLASRIFQRIKHAVERAIGRGRIPTPLKTNPIDQSRSAMDLSGKDKPSVDRETKDKDQEKQGRNWGELFFHGFARRLLGKDAYMYAIQQEEKQEAARQNQDTKGRETPNGASKETNRPAETGRADRTENLEPQEKTGQEKAVDAQVKSPAQTLGENEKNADQQRELEEMKGKFNSLHKIITNDLEDRYTNAREVKDAYLSHYTEQLQEKLTEINHGDPVQVSASRKDGKLEFCINTGLDSFGGYASFMGCSGIQIEVDGHLNVVSAEAFVPTRQLQDGTFAGRKIDVSETLGAYIVSDLAKNFREDYNRGSESYNLTSRNEFEKTVRDAAASGRERFIIDNISYSISVNKDHSIQISQDAGGKTFTIAMDAAPVQAETARETYEAKTQELQSIERALESARRTYSEMEAARQPLQEQYDQASEKAKAADKQYKDIQREIYRIEKQLSGTYLGAQETSAQNQKKLELETEKKTAFKEQKQTVKEQNLAHAALDTADQALQGQQLKIDALEQKAEFLRDACRETKEQYDAVSLQQKETVKEAYQSHIENVAKSRESSIRAFEEILPECKNELGGNFTLDDLNTAMEETGRTSMEEALYAQEMGGDRAEPSIGEEHETGRDDQELGAEIG